MFPFFFFFFFLVKSMQSEVHCVQKHDSTVTQEVNCTEALSMATWSGSAGVMKTRTVSYLVLLRVQPGNPPDEGQKSSTCWTYCHILYICTAVNKKAMSCPCQCSCRCCRRWHTNRLAVWRRGSCRTRKSRSVHNSTSWSNYQETVQQHHLWAQTGRSQHTLVGFNLLWPVKKARLCASLYLPQASGAADLSGRGFQIAFK